MCVCVRLQIFYLFQNLYTQHSQTNSEFWLYGVLILGNYIFFFIWPC